MTPARLRPLAEEDLVAQTRYYRSTGGDDVGARFLEAALAALRALEEMPGVGSPHLGAALEIPGLRVRRVGKFPCRWYYFVRDDHLDVVRLLADARDVAAILGESG